MPIKEVTYKNIKIRRFEHFSNDPRARGIFVCMVKGIVDNERRFFYDSFSYLRRFLNYLTLYCKHGFKDMDDYIYHDKEIENDTIFDERKLPPIAAAAIAHTYNRSNISECIMSSLKKADYVQPLNSFSSKIENALLLYRSSFFQESEGMRYILRFTALESLTENHKSAFEYKLIKKIMNTVRNICNQEKLSANDIDKICSHIGQLTKESIKSMIKNTLNKYGITRRGEKVDVEKLYKARNKFVHEGVEIENIHRLSIVIENIIPNLVNQLMKNSPNQSNGNFPEIS